MDKLTAKYQNHIRSLFDVECNVFNVASKMFYEPCSLFCTNCPQKCDFNKTHLYGCYESVRWDNKYIYYCPCGYIFIAVPVYDEYSVLTEGVITGPLIMGNPEDFDNEYSLPNYSTKQVNDIAELVSAVFDPKIKARTNEYSTDEFLNTVYEELEVSSFDSYPIELEKELRQSIKDRNKEHSTELLNKLLGKIFFHSNGDFTVIKTRVLELIVLLSRSAIEGGADVHQILNLNNNYITEVENFKSLEELSVWLSDIINRFVSYVFEFADIKHADTIYKVTAFVKNNYMKKISLDDIAEHVFMSKTYVSKIFKEEMGISLSSYINETRIEKSMQLLADDSVSIADVANLVGFDGQSYFTKIFKSITGVSPGTYRERRGKF